MQKKRILIVDDEPSFTRLLGLNLEHTGRYEVREEARGKEVMRAVEAFQPDLILLDVIMPDLDGAQVGAQLRDHAMFKDIPVVFVTAIVSREEVGTKGHMIGDNLFLAKPVKIQEVVQCIEERLAVAKEART